ncbi:glycosyltransferase family 2 protein [Blautia massiliensis]|uniref:glycosyltransferase family A protein n=2 Tax=Blautia massiliensis (ex Durand et al. 2017) TaxID=1737424 RepID=UPI00191E578D|nr:glycosyltransferase family A protein [Blautia massiliensis (ex Durand et al. 2017)]NSK93091.1 glycosyltransferase family 2 protein [Blautia massiliensis (ex Durand et al. 2017)]
MNLKKLAGRSEFMYQSSRKGREMESSMDKVLTVIVPVYNMEKYIRQCLESLVIGGGAGGVGWLQGWFCGDRV